MMQFLLKNKYDKKSPEFVWGRDKENIVLKKYSWLAVLGMLIMPILFLAGFFHLFDVEKIIFVWLLYLIIAIAIPHKTIFYNRKIATLGFVNFSILLSQFVFIQGDYDIAIGIFYILFSLYYGTIHSYTVYKRIDIKKYNFYSKESEKEFDKLKEQWEIKWWS